MRTTDWRHAGIPYTRTAKVDACFHAYPRDRGLKPATLEAAGARIVNGYCIFENWPGVRAEHPQADVLGGLSLSNADGTECSMRVLCGPTERGDFPKFVSSPGMTSGIYIPPRLGKTPKGDELVIVEGWFKALAAAQAGLNSIGIIGCWGWRDPVTKQMRAELAAMIKPGMRVYPALDADCRTNSQVARALVEFCREITRLGGIVVLRFLPDLGDGKSGLDDLLAALGRKGFDALPTHTMNSPEFRKVAARVVAHTDLGLAEAFILLYGDDVKFDVRTNEVWSWTGTRWESGEHVAAERMKDTVRQLGAFAKSERCSGAAELLQKFATRSESSKHMRAALEHVKTDPRVAIDSTKFDQRPELIGVGDEVLNIDTGEVAPAAREHMVTMRAGFTYDPKAKAPLFVGMVKRAMPNDPALVGYTQEALGSAWSGRPMRGPFLFLYGPGGTAKSVTLETLKEAFGDYAVTISADVLIKAREGRDPEAPTPQLIRMRGKRYAAIPEMRDKVIDSTFIKNVRGGDTISGRGLNRDPIEFRNAAVPVARTNHFPQVDHRDPAALERVGILPFLNVIPESERDPSLRERITASELPGVFNWLFDGYKRWMARGCRLEVPESVRKLIATERAKADLLGLWLDENIEQAPDARELSREVYENFKAWMRENGHEEPSAKTFWADMRARLEREPILASNGSKLATGLRIVNGLHVKGDALMSRTMRRLADAAPTEKERVQALARADAFDRQTDVLKRQALLKEFQRLAAAFDRPAAPPSNVVPFNASASSAPSRDKSSPQRGRDRK